MPARDDPGAGRIRGNDLSEDTTETMMMRPVRSQGRAGSSGGPRQGDHESALSGGDRGGDNRGRDEHGPDEHGPDERVAPERDSPRPPEQPPQDPAARSGGGMLARSVRTMGELFITLGIVTLLFVVYELYITNIFSAAKQAQADESLSDRWQQQDEQRGLHVDPVDGEAFARIYIPSFGADYNFTIQEGVGADALEVGPGHYENSALPGDPGNFAVAGHRVGKGAPFNDLDLLDSCDPVVIETSSEFYVYRVLPMADEVDDWQQTKESREECENVSSLRSSQSDDEPYAETFGRRIVDPGLGSAVSAVPYQPQSSLPKSQQVDMMTMTTCHPQFSAAERMIIHAELVRKFEKGPDSGGYKAVLKEIGAAGGR